MSTFKQELQKGIIHDFYLFYGCEDYLINESNEELIKAILGDDRSLNFYNINNDNYDLNSVLSIASSIPFMGDKKVILFDNLKLFASGTSANATKGKELKNALESIPSGNVFIFNEVTVDKKSTLFKFITENGKALELNSLESHELETHINNIFKESGLTINSGVLNMFIDMVGSSLTDINNECFKLISYKESDENKEITASDVKAITSHNISYDVFKIVNEISKGTLKSAFQKYNDMLELKEDPVNLFWNLNKEFQKIMIVKSCLNNKLSFNDTMLKSGIRNDWVLKQYINLAGKFTFKSLDKICHELELTDYRIKNGLVNSRLATEMFINSTFVYRSNNN